MYDFQMAYLNAIQQKWFEEHVRDYKGVVRFTTLRIILQVTPEAGAIAFHIHGNDAVVSLYFMNGKGKVWQPRTRGESQELLKFAFSPEIPELGNKGFETVKALIIKEYGY